MSAQVSPVEQSAPALLTPRQLEKEFGISVSTQASWRCYGGSGLPYLKLAGKSVYYRRADVLAWLDANAHNPGQSRRRAVRLAPKTKPHARRR